MTARVEIRPAMANDISAITDIYGHHVRFGTASFEIEAPDEAEMMQRLLDVQSRGLPYLVAEQKGEVCGYAYVAPYRTRVAYRFTVEDSVYIHPAHLGEGIGTMLLTSLVSACQGAGPREIIAVIGDSNNTASIRLHEKLEFRHAGVLKNVGFKFDRWLDTVLMQRSL
jgi:phosphinothricin acetyltransferase